MKVYLGIDWGHKKHDAMFLNQVGACLAQLSIPHNPQGFLQLDYTREQLGVSQDDCIVGLETAHNLLIDFFWDRGYQQVYVVPPSVTRSNRGRYRSSGARSDPTDAFVVADILRTDQGRLQPWFPDSQLTREIRAKVSLIGHLTGNIISLSNRLREVLWRYHPAAAEVFSDLTTQIALAFVRAYPTPQEATSLSFDQFQAFARKHHYPNPRALTRCFARLQVAQPQANPETVLVYQGEAPLLAELLLPMIQAKKRALEELQILFKAHPDHPIYNSLPGAGDLLAPSLLAKFGDDRKRFPTPTSVQALAGTSPVTEASGKWKVIKFRFACDREFRHIAQQWARCSLKQSVWANAYYDQVRPHCRSKSHAYRCLANRWLAIAWKLWQSHEPYDEAYHLRQRALRSQARS